MSPAELSKLAAFLGNNKHHDPLVVASKLTDAYVIFERTVPVPTYCDECGFNRDPGNHHPKCTQYDRAARLPGDRRGFGRQP